MGATELTVDRACSSSSVIIAVTGALIGELNRRFISDEPISISKAVSAAFALDLDWLQSLLNRYGTVLKINRHAAAEKRN